MLVLSRKSEESLFIGDDIVVTILGIERDRVKIGISAPRDVPVVRHDARERGERRPLATALPRTDSGDGQPAPRRR